MLGLVKGGGGIARAQKCRRGFGHNARAKRESPMTTAAPAEVALSAGDGTRGKAPGDMCQNNQKRLRATAVHCC